MDSNTRKKLIQQIADLPQDLRAVVAGLNDDHLNMPYREGGWTVRQVVHHVADSHINAFARFRTVLTEDHPTLKPYDQDKWVLLADVRDLPPEVSLKILEGLHQRWAYMLANLNEEDWRRGCYHPEDGELTLDELLSAYANHGIKHIGHINGLKERLKL